MLLTIILCGMRKVAVAVLLLAACAQVTGIDAYRVSDQGRDSGTPAATREEVMAFLGGGSTCFDCIRGACPDQADECAADSACAKTAKCMGECTDPGCVMTKCSGAFQPEDPSLLRTLGECAKATCADACEIGRSWGCLGRWDWPRSSNTAFDFPFQLMVFESPAPLAGAQVDLCVRGTDCMGANLLDHEVTDEQGRGVFTVTPAQYLGTRYVPPAFIRTSATARTVPHRFESTAPIAPYAETWKVNAVSFETGHGEGRYLYGVVFDCRATLMMAAQGVDLAVDWAPVPPGIFYWPEIPAESVVPINTGTTLTGVFSTLLDGANGPVPPGTHRIEMQDHVTHEVRARYDAEITVDGSTFVGFLPLTSQ